MGMKVNCRLFHKTRLKLGNACLDIYDSDVTNSRDQTEYDPFIPLINKWNSKISSIRDHFRRQNSLLLSERVLSINLDYYYIAWIWKSNLILRTCIYFFR